MCLLATPHQDENRRLKAEYKRLLERERLKGRRRPVKPGKPGKGG